MSFFPHFVKAVCLGGVCSAFLIGGPIEFSFGEEPSSALKAAIKTLSDALIADPTFKTDPTLKDPGVQEQLRSLQKNLSAALCAAAADPPTCYLGQIKEIVTAWKTPPVTEATATQLASINSIKADLENKFKPQRRKINIIGAWYGDIYSIRAADTYRTRSKPPKYHRGRLHPLKDGYRFCSASRAIRANCQGKTACYEPVSPSTLDKPQTFPDGNTTDLTGEKLCGYDPAPTADASYKGVEVAYECLTQPDDTWSDLANELPRSLGNRQQYITLREKITGQIRCSGNAGEQGK
jgi:hypothetical protein